LTFALTAQRSILAQDDRDVKQGGIELDFQVNGETYFVSLAENEAQWLVYVSSADGPRQIPVYIDAPEFQDSLLVPEDQRKRHILN